MPPIAVIPALAVLAGTVCGIHVHVPHAWRGSLVILLVVPLAAALCCWWRGRARGLLVSITIGCAIASALLAGVATSRALHSELRDRLDARFGQLAIDTPPAGPTTEPLLARYVILEDAALNGDSVSMRVATVAIEIDGRWHAVPREGVRLSVTGDAAAMRINEWRAGRTIRAPSVFRRPASYFNEGVADFERELALADVTLFASVKSGWLVDVERRGSAIEEMAARIRAHVRSAVTAHVGVHAPVAAGIVIAVLIGDRTGMPDDVRERLQAAGTYHVIAISGGNIALLAGLVLLLARLAMLGGRPAAGAAIVVLVAYAQVVTAGPSVWRATVMAVLYLLGQTLDLRVPAWQAMGVAVMVLVLASPLDISDPGFLLTFGATAALLEGARRAHALIVRRVRKDAPRTVSGWRGALAGIGWWVVASICASVAVEIALVPVAAQSFSRVTAAGILLNLLAVPLMAVVQMAGILLVCATSIDGVAVLAGRVAGWAANGITESARLVDLLPVLAPRVPPPGLVLVSVYYAGLGIVLMGRRRALRGAGLLATCVTACCMVGGFPVTTGRSASRAATEARVTMLDVGQAESILVEVPGAGPLLIDAGGAPFGSSGDRIGTRVVAPALWARGVRRLEALLVTHGDPDHIGGAAAVTRDFRPQRIWTGVPMPAHEPTRALLAQGDRAEAVTEMLRRGTVRPWGRARIRVLHPQAPDWERPRVRNDDSVVLEITFGDVALLLTGDVSAEVEREIVPQLTPARIRILKVGHHGSRTSTSEALVASWRPQIAILSCGRGNRFGHPTPEVLKRLASIGARVYRTDHEGQITIETDGAGVRVRTWMKGRETKNAKARGTTK